MVHGTRDREWDRQSSSTYEGLSLSCIEDHDRQLRELFAILWKHKLSPKPDKCKMLVTRVNVQCPEDNAGTHSAKRSPILRAHLVTYLTATRP